MFSNPFITIAGVDDIPLLLSLLNSAYRGESSKKGWTTEAHLIAGKVRTTSDNLFEIMQMPASVMLKYTNAAGEIIGCVNLQQQGNKIYLGMLSVVPQQQSAGIGKQLLRAAEEYGRNGKCSFIFMSVISLRTELIEWYKRNGYYETGEKKEFEEDEVTGKHLQPLEFILLEKNI